MSLIILFFTLYFFFFLFFFNDTATTEIYTLSLHDALPISTGARPSPRTRRWPWASPPTARAPSSPSRTAAAPCPTKTSADPRSHDGDVRLGRARRPDQPPLLPQCLLDGGQQRLRGLGLERRHRQRLRRRRRLRQAGARLGRQAIDLVHHQQARRLAELEIAEDLLHGG